jgi:hypothetical protein
LRRLTKTRLIRKKRPARCRQESNTSTLVRKQIFVAVVII